MPNATLSHRISVCIVFWPFIRVLNIFSQWKWKCKCHSVQIEKEKCYNWIAFPIDNSFFAMKKSGLFTIHIFDIIFGRSYFKVVTICGVWKSIASKWLDQLPEIWVKQIMIFKHFLSFGWLTCGFSCGPTWLSHFR